MSLTRVETSDPIFQTVYNYAYLISMSLILINIFVGILVDAFAEQKREMRCSERRMQLSHYSMVPTSRSSVPRVSTITTFHFESQLRTTTKLLLALGICSTAAFLDRF